MNYKDYFIETLYLMSYNEIVWMIIGFLGQTIFFLDGLFNGFILKNMVKVQFQ